MVRLLTEIAQEHAITATQFEDFARPPDKWQKSGVDI